MKARTKVKAGAVQYNHNEAMVEDRSEPETLEVKTEIKAGIIYFNHNEAMVEDRDESKASSTWATPPTGTGRLSPPTKSAPKPKPKPRTRTARSARTTASPGRGPSRSSLPGRRGRFTSRSRSRSTRRAR